MANSDRQKTIARRNALRERLKELEGDQKMHAGGKLVAFQAPKSGVKNLWMVDLQASRATLFDVQSPGDSVEAKYGVGASPFAIVASVKRELTKHTKTRQIVVVLRPSVAGRGDALLEAFRSSGYQVALELLDEDTRISRPRDKPSDEEAAP